MYDENAATSDPGGEARVPLANYQDLGTAQICWICLPAKQQSTDGGRRVLVVNASAPKLRPILLDRDGWREVIGEPNQCNQLRKNAPRRELQD